MAKQNKKRGGKKRVEEIGSGKIRVVDESKEARKMKRVPLAGKRVADLDGAELRDLVALIAEELRLAEDGVVV